MHAPPIPGSCFFFTQKPFRRRLAGTFCISEDFILPVVEYFGTLHLCRHRRRRIKKKTLICNVNRQRMVTILTDK